MIKQIVKIVFEDGETVEETGFKELKNFNQDSYKPTKKAQIRIYKSQFVEFERTILSYLHNDTIEEYSIDNCDVVHENETECTCLPPDIDDFDDDELIRSAISRGLIPSGIDSNDNLKRFAAICERATMYDMTDSVSEKEIDTVLKRLETKANL